MQTTITLTEVIDYLNQLLFLDRPAIAALIANRVPCNGAMASHPSVQVMEQHGGFHVGLLGILNGMFGTLNGIDGPIATVWEDGHLMRFAKRTEFNPEPPQSSTEVEQ